MSATQEEKAAWAKVHLSAMLQRTIKRRNDAIAAKKYAQNPEYEQLWVERFNAQIDILERIISGDYE